MVQEQIVEYINVQMKNGVSRDTIKTTLVGAGWQAADVEDTLKKIEAAKTAQPMSSTMPASSAAAKPAESVGMSSKPMTSAGGSANPAPQTIKMSDLVSSSPATPMSAPAKPMTTMSKSPLTGPAMPAEKKPAESFQAASYPGMKPHASRGALITEIVLVVIIMAVGGFAGFLYVQNGSLNSQLHALNGQSSGVNSQLAALQAQVAASTTALTAQVASLNGETQDLQTELSFYVVPPGTAPGATSTATLGGVVSGGGKAPYVITVTYGARVYVSNSKSGSVIAALTPLLATASTTAATAEFSGTYIPGSDAITLTEVNGSAVQ